jgi:hypothetical protein
LLGQPFLLHAAKGCTRAEMDDARRAIFGANPLCTGVPTIAAITRGAIVGRATLIGFVHHTLDGHAWTARGSREVQYNDPCRNCGERMTWEPPNAPCRSPNPWAVPGAMGLLLGEVEIIGTPIPFKGALGFFDVPDSVLAGATWKAVGS